MNGNVQPAELQTSIQSIHSIVTVVKLPNSKVNLSNQQSKSNGTLA